MMLHLINSLRWLPTIIFVVLMVLSNYAITYIMIDRNIQSLNNEQMRIDDTHIEKISLDKLFNSFKSPEYKIDWCDKRYSCRVLAESGYYEARGENDAGVLAVMSVVINRVESEHPIFANQNTIPAVVYKDKQFSYRNGKSGELPMPSRRQKERMYVLAYDKMNGLVEDVTDGSLYYYADYIKTPRFAQVYEYTVSYGTHSFYRH